MVRAAIESADLDAFADALAPDIVWIGPWPGELCRNRDDVLEMFARWREHDLQLRPQIVLDRDEAIVVDGGVADGRHHVLVLRDGAVSEVRVYPDRSSAVASIEERPW